MTSRRSGLKHTVAGWARGTRLKNPVIADPVAVASGCYGQLVCKLAPDSWLMSDRDRVLPVECRHPLATASGSAIERYLLSHLLLTSISNFEEAFWSQLIYCHSPLNQFEIRSTPMIRRMSHATIFVHNQEEALSFYRDKLGFEVHTDAMVGPDFRWLTLHVKDEPDFEIVLMEPKPGMLMDEETSKQIRAVMAKGVLGAGVFNTDDCRGTYEELKSKGVEFVSEPAERPYGIEAVFKDNSGNWFSLTQPSEGHN